MRSSVVLIAVAGAMAASPGGASAGRRHLPWSQSTEVVPERGYEVESWVVDELGVGDADVDQTRLGWAVAIGVTDQLELRLPAEVSWTRAAADPAARTTIEGYGAEARWRLVSSDPVDAPPLVPLLRVAVLHQANERKTARVEADAVVSYQRDCVLALADLGVTAMLRRGGEDVVVVRPSGGLSVLVGHDVRLGAEAYAEIAVHGTGEDWVAAGPTVAWTHGRGWLTLHAGIGVYGIVAAPRLDWGIAF